MIVILNDIELDHPKVFLIILTHTQTMMRLNKVFGGYSSISPPPLFILMGNFISSSFSLGILLHSLSFRFFWNHSSYTSIWFVIFYHSVLSYSHQRISLHICSWTSWYRIKWTSSSTPCTFIHSFQSSWVHLSHLHFNLSLKTILIISYSLQILPGILSFVKSLIESDSVLKRSVCSVMICYNDWQPIQSIQMLQTMWMSVYEWDEYLM